MYKLFVFVAILAVASAAPGYYGAPLGAPIASPWGHGVVSPLGVSPLGVSPYGVSPYGVSHVGVSPLGLSPVVKTALPVATSYANTVRIASPGLVAAHGPVVASPLVASPYAHAW